MCPAVTGGSVLKEEDSRDGETSSHVCHNWECWSNMSVREGNLDQRPLLMVLAQRLEDNRVLGFGLIMAWLLN